MKRHQHHTEKARILFDLGIKTVCTKPNLKQGACKCPRTCPNPFAAGDSNLRGAGTKAAYVCLCAANVCLMPDLCVARSYSGTHVSRSPAAGSGCHGSGHSCLRDSRVALVMWVWHKGKTRETLLESQLAGETRGRCECRLLAPSPSRIGLRPPLAAGAPGAGDPGLGPSGASACRRGGARQTRIR